MKKFYLSLLLLLPLLCHAEKVLTSFNDEDGTSHLSYDAAGHMTSVVISEVGEPDFTAFTADWSKYSQGVVKLNMSEEFESVSLDIHLDENGRATDAIYTPLNLAMYKFSYDAEGHITSIIIDTGDGELSERNVTWLDGNVVQIIGKQTIWSDEPQDFTIDIYYTNDKVLTPIPNVGGIVGDVCAFSVELDDGGMYNIMQFMKLTGKPVKNLPLKAVFTLTGNDSPFICDFEYALDTDGYPIKITEREEVNEVNVTTFTWGEIEAGIADVAVGERTVVGYYNLNGIKLEEPAKGLNIVRYSDGSCDKMVLR